MGRSQEYTIAYKGLSTGVYEFSFAVDATFFKRFEKSMIEEGGFTIEVVLEKKSNLMTLDLMIKGGYKVPCDRCLRSIDIPVERSHKLFVKFDEEERFDDDVLYIHPNSHLIQLETVIYEYIHLSLPMVNIVDCTGRDDLCDQALLEKMTPENSEQTGDTVWSELKKLKF